ncbi:hypothetical protein, partial [Brochothrix thermosphacta]|uniref:hypothetical protein n=1 Tax=Brochothrix thermosphacta TaxID=2756 RepID=UPI003F95D2B5
KRGSECLLKPVSNIDFNPMLVSSNRHTYVWNVKHTKVEYDLREHPTINLYATKKVSLSLNSSPAENY